MGIHKYQVINPTTNTKRPFFDEKKGLFYVPIKHKYSYFVEAVIADQDNGGYKYYILLGRTKFDDNCRKCHTDGYGRCQIKVKGIIKEFIIKETKERGNIDIEYIESADSYDVFNIY